MSVSAAGIFYRLSIITGIKKQQFKELVYDNYRNCVYLVKVL